MGKDHVIVTPAVIKSNVRRYLNENHNVTNASEFVEACHSYKGVKGVLALNCRLQKNDEKNNTKCTINQIRNLNNFEYKADGLLVHRSWNVGLGMLIQWSRLNFDHSIGDIVSNTDEDHSHDWVYTEDRCNHHTKDADECEVDGDEVSQSSDAQTKLYSCDVEEGCTAEFLNFGSLINHILLGKHRRTVERFSLKDTAMKVYHCKLEEVGNRQMISIDLNLREPIQSQAICLSKGWGFAYQKTKEKLFT